MKKLTFGDFIFGAFKAIGFQAKIVDEVCSGHWIEGGVLLDLVPVFLAELAAAGLLGLFYVGLQTLLCCTYRKITRPKYYPQENARRRILAAERRKIRQRRTLNTAPTAAELRAQYAKVRRNPREMIRFGSMLSDLEAYVDNGLVRDEHGTITGRRPGIKGWLAKHCPEMYAHYKSVIRYKALAEKFRQAVGLADPHPAAEALGDEIKPPKRTSATDVNNENANVETMVRKSYEYAFKVVVEKARNEAERIFSEAGLAETGLTAALWSRLDPDLILDSGKIPHWFGRKTKIA